MYKLTFDYLRNKLRFVCPIFNSETSMASCMFLRNMVWGGGTKPLEKRRGCQACMMSGKCPASKIVQMMTYGADKNSDDYGSLTPTVAKLAEPVLAGVRRVMVQQKHLDFCQVPENERLLIESANERIDKMIGSAPARQSGVVSTRHSPPRSATKSNTRRLNQPANTNAAPKKDEALQQAAMSGDLSAALNAGA